MSMLAANRWKRPPTRGRAARRRGLSLLEVILAIAILGGAMTVIGEMVRIGSIAGAQARDLTTAQILCETKMAELAAGLETLQTVTSVPFDPSVAVGWTYSVSAQAIDDQGLMAVQVLVEQDISETNRPVSFLLSRWLIDPALTLGATTTGTSGSYGPGATSTGSSSQGGF